MATLSDSLDRLSEHLTLLKELGERTIEIDRALLSECVATPRQNRLPSAPTAPPSVVYVPPQTSTPVHVATETPDATRLIADISACCACSYASNRTRVLSGAGNTHTPDIMFIGDAPTIEDEAQGMPFSSEVGALLTKMIQAMGYTRDDVFLTTVCKCPASTHVNQKPTATALKACLPLLRRQIAMIRPKTIVLLGREAMFALFPNGSIQRGQWNKFDGIPIIATYHPSHILRFGGSGDGVRKAKMEVWNTLKLVLATLGKTPPTKKTNT